MSDGTGCFTTFPFVICGPVYPLWKHWRTVPAHIIAPTHILSGHFTQLQTFLWKIDFLTSAYLYHKILQNLFVLFFCSDKCKSWFLIPIKTLQSNTKENATMHCHKAENNHLFRGLFGSWWFLFPKTSIPLYQQRHDSSLLIYSAGTLRHQLAPLPPPVHVALSET